MLYEADLHLNSVIITKWHLELLYFSDSKKSSLTVAWQYNSNRPHFTMFKYQTRHFAACWDQREWQHMDHKIIWGYRIIA